MNADWNIKADREFVLRIMEQLRAQRKGLALFVEPGTSSTSDWENAIRLCSEQLRYASFRVHTCHAHSSFVICHSSFPLGYRDMYVFTICLNERRIRRLEEAMHPCNVSVINIHGVPEHYEL